MKKIQRNKVKISLSESIRFATRIFFAATIIKIYVPDYYYMKPTHKLGLLFLLFIIYDIIIRGYKIYLSKKDENDTETERDI